MVLAIVRLSVKLELTDDVHEIALRILGTKGEKPALHALECRLAMMMWKEGSLGLDVADKWGRR